MKAPSAACTSGGVAVLLVGMLVLTSCSLTVQVDATPTVTAESAVPTPPPPPSATTTDTPTPPATATATATATPTPLATSTPDLTATAGVAVRAQWLASTQQILQIDSTLTAIGTRFQGGSLNLASAAGQLQQVDQQASGVAQTIAHFPPPANVDASALAHYQQTVGQWAAAIHDVDNRVAGNDIFGTPSAVNRLEQIAGDVEKQAATLHLA